MQSGRLNINIALPDGKAPLHIAAETGNLAVVNMLLQHKAEINVTDRLGQTPLAVAVEFKRINTVKLLLENGAKFTTRTTDKSWTPLHMAANIGSIEIARLILNHVPEPKNIEDTFRQTPASLAIQKGDARMILLFIENEARGFPRLQIPSRFLPTPTVPSLARDQRMKRLLLVSQLWSAVRYRDMTLVDALISSQQSQLDWLLKTRFEQGKSALHLATCTDQDQVVRLLIDQFNMLVDDLDDDKDTQLYWVASLGNIDLPLLSYS